MRNLEDIERDLAAAREALSSVEGTPAEVYSRIVGYYRSVRNWNRGKREEYGERRLYTLSDGKTCAAASSVSSPAPKPPVSVLKEEHSRSGAGEIFLFIRSSCPACPQAKAAAERLGIPVNLVNADTEEGITEAVRHNVFSTPTAILFSDDGEELNRARDAENIGKLLDICVPV